MVDSSIQSEPGDLDDDSTTEAQPQIDGTGSESSQSLVSIKAVTASPISFSPAAKDGDEEAPSTVTHVLMTSSPALAPAETNTALVSSGEPPPSRAGSLEHGVTDSVYEVNTLVSVGIEPASPTATNPPPPISTSQQKEVVAHGAPTTTLQENTAPPPSFQVGPSDGSLQSSANIRPLIGSSIAPLGAWAKPLACVGKSFVQFDAPPEPVNWPPLSAKSVGKKVFGNEIAGNSSSNAIPPPTKAIPTDKKRFPWTARLNPKSRNLHRVTIPEYMEDSTPKVTIPNHVLLNGLQNQKEYVVGQFTRCLVPSGGLVHAVLNKIWGRKCSIFVKKISDSSYIFHIPDENTRKWVLERGLWHVDDCLMFVAAWNSKESLSLPQITSIPLWVTLKNIPAQLYSIFALEWIASGLVEPMLSHKPWLDPTMLGEAKVLVEIELDKPFPQKVAAWDKQGNYSMIDVEYTWLPSKCEKCGHLGHKAKRCLSTSQQTTPAKDHVLVVVDVSASPTSVGASSPKVNAISHPSMDQVKAADEPSSCQVDSFVKSAAVEIDFSPVVSGFNTTIVSSSPTIDMSSLASITLLENMCTSPSIICINDTIETPTQEPAQHHSATTTSPEIYTSTSNGACLDEPDLGSNKFASLLNVEEDEEDILEFDNDSEPMDYMSPFGKRILRERPVKPTTKAKEMHSQSTSRGRGSRGRSRGNRGRRG
ncbi:hypothetical protein Bca52824_043892 [Brassica carinata]|uniref:CCHC-type domain-containing protein n=1 Tax=Brassica carinata TaxID=52824 RepID=A0A8X7RZV0_BRACI|nr:hypothetical protein Bca52824_043892 [Brassica carinata]